MRGAGIPVAGTGPRGGYRLARPPADISVLDVLEAIDGDEPAFQCLEIRRRGPTAGPAPVPVLVEQRNPVRPVARTDDKAAHLRELGADPARVDLFDGDAVKQA